VEPSLSTADEKALDDLLVFVIATPESERRFPSFYEPQHPTWLLRSAPFLIHYGYEPEADEVVFLNLFRRR
jgi:hypothetical protein